jgi:hypothetical protein
MCAGWNITPDLPISAPLRHEVLYDYDLLLAGHGTTGNGNVSF